MFVWNGFDYIRLMRLGMEDRGADHAARVAVLGWCTTQYYAAVLRGLGAAGGLPVVTYEPEYSAVHQAVLDERSQLYEFEPDMVVFVTAVQGLRDLLMSVDLPDRPATATREADQLVSLIRRAAQIPGVTVVVNQLVVPYERTWGNFSWQVEGSLPNVVERINKRLRGVAAETANVHTVDCDHIASWLGKRAWFDERLWFHSKSFCHPEALPHVAGQALDIFRAVKGMGLKCIALDLDNVLWGGVVGDDGLEGIHLGDLGEGEAYVQFQRWLKELHRRGIILAVCSKNDDEKALEPFRSHSAMVLKETDMSCFIANWDNKADNLRTIARRLNIGLDSIVFIDDSPFERNLVRELAPEVCVPEMPDDAADFVPYLESLNLFEAAEFSEEDRKRADFYRSNALREAEQEQFKTVDDYLTSLESEALFERFDDAHLPRIAQLVQRTNQFNLTTIRHSAEELRQFAEDPDYLPFYVTLADRFGDNGLISVVIARREADRVDIITWVMSCRVIARRLEEFVLDELVHVCKEIGVTQLRGTYAPTKKNELVAELYERLGFRLVEERPDGGTAWEFLVDEHAPSGAPIARKVLELDA
jgi:FkbH-like protein